MNVLETSYFNANDLVINKEKAKAMSFDTQQNKSFLRPKIRFTNIEIKYKYETKFWGLHLTEILKQDINTNNLSCKLSKSFYVILSLNLQALCILYIRTGISLLSRERFLYI